jgi:hypothetical protein
MEKYLEQWLDVLQGMANDNTYKLAWGRAIIESIQLRNFNEYNDYYTISFDEISEKMLKYYWNQIFFFQLRQSPNIKKPPTIYRITYEMIQQYQLDKKTNIPIWFDKAKVHFLMNRNEYDKQITKISRTIRQDVCWRFLNANHQQYPLYELNQEKTMVIFKKDNFNILNEYGLILIQIINYRWAQLLEQFNRSPRIVSKVKGSQENQIRRKSLSRFKDLLLKIYPDGMVTDFYSGKVLNSSEISVDHVIPWSFIYNDELWNLVITSKTVNSQKSNNIPTKEIIEKLKARNRNLIDFIEPQSEKDKFLQAINNDYVTKYYLDLIS